MTQDSINAINPLLQFVTTSTNSVVTCATDLPYDNSIPQNTEGDEVLTLAITPKYSTSILEITFTSEVTCDATAPDISVALFQDATVNALAAKGYKTFATLARTAFLRHIMVSGTTSSTTFKIRVGSSTGNCYVNGDTSGNRLMGGVSNTRLTIKEYMA